MGYPYGAQIDAHVGPILDLCRHAGWDIEKVDTPPSVIEDSTLKISSRQPVIRE